MQFQAVLSVLGICPASTCSSGISLSGSVMNKKGTCRSCSAVQPDCAMCAAICWGQAIRAAGRAERSAGARCLCHHTVHTMEMISYGVLFYRSVDMRWADEPLLHLYKSELSLKKK